MAPPFRQRFGVGQRQHHLVVEAERQAAGGVHFRRQRGKEADRLVRDQVGRHGDDHLLRRHRAARSLQSDRFAGMIDPRHLALERERTGRAIGRHQRAIAARNAPVDLGVLIGIHVEHRDLVELAAVEVGRDRVDHRVPAVAGLEILRGDAVAAACRGLLDALVKRVHRGHEFGALVRREAGLGALLAPWRARLVDLEIEPMRDRDKGILVGRMQPAAAGVERYSGRGHDGVGAPADALARFQHDHLMAGIFQRLRGAEAGGAGSDDGDIDFGRKGHDVDATASGVASPSPRLRGEGWGERFYRYARESSNRPANATPMPLTRRRCYRVVSDRLPASGAR